MTLKQVQGDVLINYVVSRHAEFISASLCHQLIIRIFW